METATNKETLSKNEVLNTLRHSLKISRKPLLQDGVLLIAWGLAFSLGFGIKYYESIKLTSRLFRDVYDIMSVITALALIGLTIYYIFFRNRKLRSYAAISTRFVWIGIIVAHNMNVIITKSLLGEVDFAMLHPLQMVLIGFALFVTGGIYRFYLLSLGGILMWVAAVIGAGLELTDQYLVRAIADFVCFVIPGFLMINESKKHV